jgi:hypothetical protein
VPYRDIPSELIPRPEASGRRSFSEGDVLAGVAGAPK